MPQSVIRYAHSAQDELGNLLPYEHWQTLQSHSVNVGEMAAEFAQAFGAQEIACQTGQLHDLGKYPVAFNHRCMAALQPIMLLPESKLQKCLLQGGFQSINCGYLSEAR